MFSVISFYLIYYLAIHWSLVETQDASCKSSSCCECTTTTTKCNTPPSPDACPLAKIGKSGRPGMKGSKGEPCSSEQESISQLQEKYKQLQEIVSFYSSFPSSCSEYIQHASVLHKFDNVPLYLRSGKGYVSKTILANCTWLDEIRDGHLRDIKVPFNSIQGRTYVLKGTPPGNKTRFSINVRGPGNTIYFHFNTRPEINQLVRDDYVTGWTRTEVDLNVPYPFPEHAPFTMKIKTDEVGFHVELNGHHLLTFKHRQRPLSAVRMIEVRGTLNISSISFN